jgi:hypothetical protein
MVLMGEKQTRPIRELTRLEWLVMGSGDLLRLPEESAFFQWLSTLVHGSGLNHSGIMNP